jgi:lipopolysaccharide/colanic/teichoic acid biosynthesis glycosyltransferase
MMKNSSLLTRPAPSPEAGHRSTRYEDTRREFGMPEVVEMYPAWRWAEAPWVNSSAKRVVDLVLTILILPFALPFFVLLPLAILIESPGPIFFLHRRLGQNGSVFWMFKFRTMVDGADRILPKLLDSDPEARQEFAENYKLKNDPRVTRLGQFLRRSSLDELPQIINVLRGEISWVGPRPIVVPEIEKYGRYAGGLLRMKPGITGLWQASGRSDLPYENRVRLDMQYMEQASIWFDLKIILRTALVVLSRSGAI